MPARKAPMPLLDFAVQKAEKAYGAPTMCGHSRHKQEGRRSILMAAVYAKDDEY